MHMFCIRKIKNPSELARIFPYFLVQMCTHLGFCIYVDTPLVAHWLNAGHLFKPLGRHCSVYLGKTGSTQGMSKHDGNIGSERKA